jgi:hypothetical protein
VCVIMRVRNGDLIRTNTIFCSIKRRPSSVPRKAYNIGRISGDSICSGTISIIDSLITHTCVKNNFLRIYTVAPTHFLYSKNR